MARTSFIDAVSWSKLLIPRPAPVPGDAEHRESTIPRLCSWDLRSFGLFWPRSATGQDKKEL